MRNKGFLKTRLIFIILLILTFLLSACGSTTTSGSGKTSDQNNAKKDWPKVLTYSSIPGEGQDYVKSMQPLADDLGKALGIKVKIFVPTDYTAVIEAMRTKKVDVAEFGPFSYIIAHDRSNAQAFATYGESKEKTFYKSLIIVPAKSTVKTIDDLKGKKFLFVDPASTSGNLVPHYEFMKQFGLKTMEEVDKIFANVSFSGSHDASILAIAHGDADGAAVASNALEKMIQNGQVKESDIKIIKESDPIPQDPITFRGDLPKDLQDKIKDFFLNYNNPELFKQLKISGYYPIDDSKYDGIRDIAKTLNMSPEQLLK